MIEKLSEVLGDYSVNSVAYGEVKFNTKTSQLSVGGTRYVMLKAEGDAVKGLNDPHITIWGKNERVDSWIATVEFSWAGTYHVRYARRKDGKGEPWYQDMPEKEVSTAEKLKIVLKLFLNKSTIAVLGAVAEPVAPVVANNNNNNGLDIGNKVLWPALGGGGKK
jgi:hypothetical protein